MNKVEHLRAIRLPYGAVTTKDSVCSSRCGEECTDLGSYQVRILVPMQVIGAFLSRMITAVLFGINTSWQRLTENCNYTGECTVNTPIVWVNSTLVVDGHVSSWHKELRNVTIDEISFVPQVSTLSLRTLFDGTALSRS